MHPRTLAAARGILHSPALGHYGAPVPALSAAGAALLRGHPPVRAERLAAAILEAAADLLAPHHPASVRAQVGSIEVDVTPDLLTWSTR